MLIWVAYGLRRRLLISCHLKRLFISLFLTLESALLLFPIRLRLQLDQIFSLTTNPFENKKIKK